MNSDRVNEIKERQRKYETRMEELGLQLLNIFYSTIKTAGMYEANNNRYIEQATKLRRILDDIFKEEIDFSLSIKSGYLFISELRLKGERDTDVAMTYFLEKWPKLGVSGITFSSGLDPRELDKFVFMITGFDRDGDPDEIYALLKERLMELDIERISLLPLTDDHLAKKEESHEGEGTRNSSRAMARKTFLNAVTVVQETAEQAKNQGFVNLTKTKRVVQGLIDQIISDEAALLEMTSLRNFDDYTYVHSVNVCVLSILLGYHLGLDRKRLSHLGVGSLMHDIGKMRIPIDLLHKPETLSEYDWKLLKKHPIFGVKALLKTRIADETSTRAAVTIFEHHISYDGSGYPQLLNKRKPALFARIVAIADAYNAITSGRVYHRKKNTPEEAVSNLVNRIGSSFDPILLKVFINAIGIYPVGSIVALSSNEIGIIARNNPDDLDRPQVKVIANQDGLYDMENVKVIDLSKEVGVSVRKFIDGEKYNIDIANYLDIQ